ncbi:MAG: hypothetical protein KDA96_21380 [Planctomycetaceae bacterium]|nr:hypothetical protein [Planctomycetaceae bacterium]
MNADNPKPYIQRFLRRTGFFVCAPLLVYLPFGVLFHEQLLERSKGPNVEKQILSAFEHARTHDFDLLILGNSRMYRGVNPDRFSVPAFNLAHDDDSFNQMYYKLRWLEEQGRGIRFLAMGVDYFQFGVCSDRRNYVYTRLFDPKYAADYPPVGFFDKRNWVKPGFFNGINPKHLFADGNGRPFIRENGQYIRPGTASPADFVPRDTEKLPLQVNYFERILQHCRERDITVFLCLLPIRPEEKNAYQEGEIEKFLAFLKPYLAEDVHLLNFTNAPDFRMNDYTDITHLNETAANRFSTLLDESICDFIVSPDSRISPDEAIASPSAVPSKRNETPVHSVSRPRVLPDNDQ